MDRLDHYRDSIKAFLQEYAATWTQHPEPEVEIQLIFDEQRDRYLLLDVGWRGSQRIHHCIFHFDLKDGKIWLQENNTDLEVDQALAEMGITPQEIVIGFHSPTLRGYSDFAVA